MERANAKKKYKKKKSGRKLKPEVSRFLIALVSACAGALCMLIMQGLMSHNEAYATNTRISQPVDINSIFEEKDNPYLSRLDSMPDDGCIKIKINPIGGYLGKVFNDSNHVHLSSARALGIKPITDLSSAWELRRPIVEIKSCEDFYVDNLTHSYPFLVPEAAELLHDIGSTFNEELHARGGGDYRIKVTSVLRTPETVRRLRRINRNATEESTHQYGTTFDISYSDFIFDRESQHCTQEDLKNLLGEVLYDLRNQGRCYVKYERKQSCYHITTR